jgi:hypothetical protein
MLRSCALAVAMLLLALPALASAQTTATSGSDFATSGSDPAASGSDPATTCAEQTAGSDTTPAMVSTSGSPSGGTPAGSPESDPTMGPGGGAGEAATASGAAASAADAPMSGDVPLATVAQEPQPEPEGPGSEQPDEPGGEPQAPSGDDPVEVPSGEAPATGGGLPRTGLEVLKLGLLGLVFVLVGARIRAVLKRRGGATGLAPDGLPHDAPDAAELRYTDLDTGRAGRGEWSFPDPDEAAPTGLLPSTAMARRNARRRER